MGSYTVTLDDVLVATLSAHNDVVTHGTVLYFTSNLDPSLSHTLVLTATGGPAAQPVLPASGNGCSTLEAPATTQADHIGLVLDSWTAYGPKGRVGFMYVSLPDLSSR